MGNFDGSESNEGIYPGSFGYIEFYIRSFVDSIDLDLTFEIKGYTASENGASQSAVMTQLDQDDSPASFLNGHILLFESREEGANGDYDFYNYVVTGSGAGTIEILWDPDKFEINPFFFYSENLTPAVIASSDAEYGDAYSDWNKVTIRVDSTVKNRYEMQLYKTPHDGAATGASYTGSSAATNFIKCFFKENTD